MDVYTVYKYQIDWDLTPFSFLRGAAFAGGSLIVLVIVALFLLIIPLPLCSVCAYCICMRVRCLTNLYIYIPVVSCMCHVKQWRGRLGL